MHRWIVSVVVALLLVASRPARAAECGSGDTVCDDGTCCAAFAPYCCGAGVCAVAPGGCAASPDAAAGDARCAAYEFPCGDGCIEAGEECCDAAGRFCGAGLTCSSDTTCSDGSATFQVRASSGPSVSMTPGGPGVNPADTASRSCAFAPGENGESGHFLGPALVLGLVATVRRRRSVA